MPMLDHGSVAQLVTSSLLNDTALQALVWNRVTGGWARDTDLSTIQKPHVAVVFDGGVRHYEGVYGSFAMEIWVLSDTSLDECRSVYTAVLDVLQAECLEITGLDHRGMAEELDASREAWSDEIACWYIQSRWLLRVARDTSGVVP